MSWSITPLLLGYLRNRPKDHITYGVGAGETVDLACYGWLLRDGDQIVLVDTGPCSVEHAADFHSVQVDRTAEQSLDAALALHDVEAGDIDRVALTHLHWDHCYGLPLVPRAKVFVQEREIRYAVYPQPNDDRRKYEFGIGAPFLHDLRRMAAVDGDMELAPGVHLIATPGHSPGHQSVLVEAHRTRYLIAGDFLDLYENYNDRVPSGSGLDVEAWERTYDRVEALDIDIVLPSHDPQVLQQAHYA